jgi:outer membrane lipoprotein-sorting protein
METIENKKFRLQKWHKRAMAVAASIIFFVAVFMLSDRTPFVNTAQAAETIMARSITAMDALRSMFISMEVRSEERENFDAIGMDYDFIEYKLWKQFSGERPWRIEKPGRIAVWDGEKQYLYMPDISYALTAGKEAGFVEWMKLFFSPKSILETEIAFAKKHNAKYKIDKTGDEIILSVSAGALGDFHNNYLKNTSILSSDNSRIYTFDKETLLLKSFELFINSDGRSKLVMKINNIAYNIPIEASTFSIKLPPGVEWRELADPGYIKAFTKISSKKVNRTSQTQHHMTENAGTIYKHNETHYLYSR